MVVSRAMLSRRLFLVASLACACGGKTAEVSGDGGGGGSPDGSRGGNDSGQSIMDGGVIILDAEVHRDATPPMTCVGGPGVGSGGPNSCSIMGSEMCSNGVTYQVTCDCPQASCTCTQSGSGGGSGGIVPFSSCPACPSPSEAFTICGFPQ